MSLFAMLPVCHRVAFWSEKSSSKACLRFKEGLLCKSLLLQGVLRFLPRLGARAAGDERGSESVEIESNSISVNSSPPSSPLQFHRIQLESTLSVDCHGLALVVLVVQQLVEGHSKRHELQEAGSVVELLGGR